MREVEASFGSLPPEGVSRRIPSASDPVLRSARGSLHVLAPSDQGLRPLRGCDPLYVRCDPVPRFVGFFECVLFFRALASPMLCCSVFLLVRRLRLFVLRMFVTCEDFRLKPAPAKMFDVPKHFTSDSCDAPVHLSTPPVPQLGKVDTQLVGRGLGTARNYEISDELCLEPAPLDFEAEFSLPGDVYSPTREDMVLPMVCWLLHEGVVSTTVRGCPLRTTCWLLIIPKTTEKVSPIFNLMDLNEGVRRPESLSLYGCEPILRKLAEWPADRPLFCTNFDLKNAF